jgi:hypothetical protein
MSFASSKIEPNIIRSIGISLGWNCHTTTMAVQHGLRDLKANGYNTCPFDLMITNYEGVIQCLYDDFKDFTNPECFKLVPEFPNNADDMLLMNTKYNFCHNHESVGHANLYISENWSGGRTHFVDNNYEKLIERLNSRVQNFRDYIKSGNHINFLITDFDSVLIELHTCIKSMYPTLSYTITRYELEIPQNETAKDLFNRHMKLLSVNRIYN